MDAGVKVFEILAAVANHRARKRRPCFRGHLNRTGNEELIVLHRSSTNTPKRVA
jgi:hypothetical protein